SDFISSDPDVNAATNSEPIPYRNGQADFSELSLLELKFKSGELTGNNNSDQTLVQSKLADISEGHLANKSKAETWLRENSLTLHHADGTSLQVVPTDAHSVPHVGSACELRFQATRTVARGVLAGLLGRRE